MAPTTRYQEEIKDDAERPISYKSESRAGEKDGICRLAYQMEEGDEAGLKDRGAREARDEGDEPSE